MISTSATNVGEETNDDETDGEVDSESDAKISAFYCEENWQRHRDGESDLRRTVRCRSKSVCRFYAA